MLYGGPEVQLQGHFSKGGGGVPRCKCSFFALIFSLTLYVGNMYTDVPSKKGWGLGGKGAPLS